MDKQILDQNKNISEIRYNHLNLPKKVTLTHGEIAYTYDALGNKWFKYVGESNGQAGDEKHGTAYLFGFQYSFKYNEVVKYDWKLMHIATSEGYVSAVYPEGIDDDFKLHYVYNHTDHLGNIRQNITRKGNEIDILKEDNYYPFGLTHRGYNEQKEELKYDPEQDRIFTIQAQASRYKYMFQGQERQTDIDLNWDSFKYRNYDYAIGRFFNVDPLAEKFPYNGVYNFSENRVVDGVELEGLEVLLINANARASLLLTISVKGGFYIDFSKQELGLFFTPSVGIGLAAGGSIGVGATFYPTASINDVKGWGYSPYIFSITPGLKVGGSLEMAVNTNDYTHHKFGVSAGTGIGLEAILAAAEGNYTFIYRDQEIISDFFKAMDKYDQDAFIDNLIKQREDFSNKMMDAVRKWGNLERQKKDANKKQLKKFRSNKVDCRERLKNYQKIFILLKKLLINLKN